MGHHPRAHKQHARARTHVRTIFKRRSRRKNKQLVSHGEEDKTQKPTQDVWPKQQRY